MVVAIFMLLLPFLMLAWLADREPSAWSGTGRSRLMRKFKNRKTNGS